MRSSGEGYNAKQFGFTLIEIALVVLIISLISGGILYGISEYQKSYKDRDSKQRLLYVKKMLLNFVSTNNFVPCPDTDGDGVENRTDIACTSNHGGVPYNTIGLQAGDAKDSWGNMIDYYVPINADNKNQICADDSRFSASYLCKNPPGFYSTETPPTDSNRDNDNTYDILDASATGNTVATDVPIVLVAMNANGKQSCSALSPDEQENCDGDQQFVMHERTDNPFFDDNVLGISGYEIKRKNVIDATALLLKGCIINAICDDLKNSGLSSNELDDYANNLQGEPKSLGMRGLMDAKQNMTENDYDEFIQRVQRDTNRMNNTEIAYINNKANCRTPPSSYQINPASYTQKNEIPVNETIRLGQNGVLNNLYVSNSVLPNASVFGGDTINDVYIANDNYGVVSLGGDDDSVIIGNDSAGSVFTGDGNDTVRVCGNAQSIEYSAGYDINPVRLKFENPRRLMGHGNVMLGHHFHQGNVSRSYAWLYRNIIDDSSIPGTDQVDAIVEIVDSAPGFLGFCNMGMMGMMAGPGEKQFCLNYIDIDRIGYSNAIQTGYSVGEGFDRNDEIWIEIQVSFFKHAAGRRQIPSIPRKLSFYASAVDLDAWRGDWMGYRNLREQYEYTWFYSPLFGLTENTHNQYSNNPMLISYYGGLNNVPYTFMDVTVDNNILKAVSSEPWVTPGLDVDFTQTLVSGGYKNVSAFKYRIGLKVEERLYTAQFRYNSIWFGDPPYEQENVIPVSGNIDLGDGADSLTILSDSTLNINSGGGGDYIYVLGGSYQKLVGSDDDDLVATIGDLGYATGANTPGWDLMNGNNSAYVNGSCYAPLSLGQDNDIVVVNGDLARDCSLQLDDGNDYLYVMGNVDVDIDSGGDNDFIDVDSVPNRSVSITLQDGDDVLIVHDVFSGSINSGQGDDYIELNTIDPSASVIGGLGSDTLVLKGVSLYDWNNGVDAQVSGFEEVQLMDATVTP